MSRAVQLDTAIHELETALTDLKAIRDNPIKSRASIQAVSTRLNTANGRLASIMHARIPS